MLDVLSALLRGESPAEAYYRRGVAQQAAGDLESARASYARALGWDGRHAGAHNNLGWILHSRGELDAAIACYERALEADARAAEAARNLAIAWQAKGDPVRAEPYSRRTLELQPQSAAAFRLRADILRECGRLDEALACAREALRLEPRDAGCANSVGLALRQLGRSEEAAAAFASAVALDDRLAEAHHNLGLELKEMRDFPAALAQFRAAAERDPLSADAQLSLGAALEASADAPQAIEHYRRAISLRPDLAQAHFNHALQLLHAEDYARAWEEFEWRWRIPELSKLRPQFAAPAWEGGAIGGRSVLVYTEQGFGDAIQFVRYLPLLAQGGARVLLLCPPALRRLLGGLAGVSAAASEGEPVPQTDLSCALLSLPLRLGRAAEPVPARVPYLSAEPAATERFRAILGSGAPKIGLAWASHSPRPGLAELKSLPLRALAPLGRAAAGARFYSLQKGASAAEAGSPPPGLALVDLSAELRDFADTAAVIANLDLVISVDTAVAHLAGALGKPVWTLVPFPPDWRWQRSGEACAWYPTMRLFRQRRSYAWEEVFQAVAAALGTRLGIR